MRSLSCAIRRPNCRTGYTDRGNAESHDERYGTALSGVGASESESHAVDARRQLTPAGPSDRISPTAHFTGAVWRRHGLAPPFLGTKRGWLAVRAADSISRLLSPVLSGLNVETYLLDRHLTLDAIIGEAIEAGRVRQVLEVAAGLSPRGHRLVRRFGQDRLLRYVEADLGPMAELKRERLAGAGALEARHRVVSLDVLASAGPSSLESLVERELVANEPVAIVAEGLLNYFEKAEVQEFFSRIAAILRRQGGGSLVSNLELGSEAGRYKAIRWAFLPVLALATGTRGGLHFADEGEVEEAVCDSGFEASELHRPRQRPERGRAPKIVRILEATVSPWPRTPR